MHCIFSVAVSNTALPALYYVLGLRFGADMLLSPVSPIHPANTLNLEAPETFYGHTRKIGCGFSVPPESGAAAIPEHVQGDGRSIIGIAAVRDLVVQADTDRNRLYDFCFDRPHSVLPATFGYLSYTYGLVRYGIASDKPHDLPLGHLKQYAIQLHVVPCNDDPGRSLVSCLAADAGKIGSKGGSATGASVSGALSGNVLGTASGGGVNANSGAAGRAGTSSVPMGALLRELETLCRLYGTNGAGDMHTPVYAPPLSSAELAVRLRQSLSAKDYAEGVEKVLEHIRDGDSYQLNLSTRFAVELHGTRFDPLALFMHFVQHNPAPFYAWLGSGSKRILSTSPERFLRVRGGDVLAQPIKGTLAFDSYTSGMERSLTQSPKESAELSMIVDLIRNDISAHCEYGSVRVDNHKATFTVDSLVQMYSDVRGTLRGDATCLDLLLDAFPGGSITGCPKRRTMRIIESLEPHCRDLYCGSIFCIEDERTMDSSIAIRTGWYDIITATLCFFAGSGIVIDSIPDREYAETLAKAGKFLRALIR